MIKIYLLGALLVAVALGSWHYRSVLADNKDLKAVKKADTATINALDDNADTERKIGQTERNRRNEIRKAPKTDNGTLAPVLRRTLARGM